MTNTHGLTEEDLAGLSAEERAAVTAEPSEDEARLAAGAPGTENTESPEKPEGTTEGEPAKAAAAEEGGGTQPAEREPLAVAFDAPPVDKAKVDAEVAELQKKFDDGELTLTEFLEQRDAAMEPLRDAKLSAKHKIQVETELWTRTVDAFLDEHDIYRKDPVLNDALDATIKRMANDPANQNLTDRQLINQAHEEITKRFAAAAETPKPQDPKAALAGKRKPDLSAVPTTLAQVPAATPANVDVDEFSDLDALQAKAAGGDADAQMAYEQRLARMTPEQQDRYLRAA